MEKAKSTKLTKRNPIKPEIKKIIRQLKNNRLSIREIPIEFASDINILRVERELGIRKTTLRGFDVINQDFFVEEELLSRDFEVLYSPKRTFKDFQEYYNYLEGDIYENACYYQYKFSDSFSKSMNLNLRKLKRKDRAPNLYLKYQNMLENDPTISLTIYEPKEEMTLLPQNYLETDIYKVSRELKRMQKLDSNILTIWYDPVSNEYALTSENEDCHSGNGISNDNLIEKISTLQSK